MIAISTTDSRVAGRVRYDCPTGALRHYLRATSIVQKEQGELQILVGRHEGL